MKPKRISVAYLLLLLGGIFGAHDFYTRKPRKAIIKILLVLALPVSTIINEPIVFSIASAILLVLLVIDLFILKKRVDKWNFEVSKANDIQEKATVAVETREYVQVDEENNNEEQDEENENYEEDGDEETEEVEYEESSREPSPIKAELKAAGKKIGANIGTAVLTTAIGPLRLITDPLLKAATGKNTEEIIGGKLGATVSSSKKENYLEKKRRGAYSTFGGIRVSGGLLPKSGSIGSIEIHYDEDLPHLTGSRGGKSIYQAKGNIQIFVQKDAISKLEKMEFIAKSVDKYYR